MTSFSTDNPFLTTKFILSQDGTAACNDIVQTRDRARHEVWEYRLMFVVLFLAMLFPTVASRLMPSVKSENNTPHQTILQEASAKASRILPFIFMG